MRKTESSFKRSIAGVLINDGQGHNIVKFLIIFISLIVIAFIVWASSIEVDEVSIAPGKIIPYGRIKTIQHPFGGVVSQILIKNGDIVKKGQTLIVFDKDIIHSQITEAQLKHNSLKAKRSYFLEQIKIKEKLVNKGLNARLSLLKLKSEFSDFEVQFAQSQEALVRAMNRLHYHEVKSPVNGVVHNFEIFTTGAVIEKGSALLQVIPHGASMIAEIEISPGDIGHTRVGLPVQLKFATFDFGRFGGVTGELIKVSPSTILSNTQKVVYRGFVKLNRNYIGIKSADFKVKVGMTLTAEIVTGKKKIIEYLLKPIFTSANLAMRER